jgi:CDP-diacylglycerol---glycerol-3-phosphate 3-phosphatidyltransferase
VFDPAMRAIGGAFVRAHITPNAITTLGTLLAIGCAWIIIDGRPVLAGLLLIPVLLLDVVDGAAARVSNSVTVWGGFYDSSCDRITDGAIVGAIAYSYRFDESTLIAALLAGIAGALVPYTRAKAEALKLEPGSGPGERADRMVLIVAGLVLSLVELMLWISVAAATITIVKRLYSIRKQASQGAVLS